MRGSRPLEKFWETCSPEQKAAAPGLISRYMRAAQLRANCLSWRFPPGDDVEPRVMYALYKAAYTYVPGKATFATWLQQKVRGETSMLCRRAGYRERYHIRVSNASWYDVDQRFYYSGTAS